MKKGNLKKLVASTCAAISIFAACPMTSLAASNNKIGSKSGYLVDTNNNYIPDYNVLYGDSNNDGVINISDYVFTMWWIDYRQNAGFDVDKYYTFRWYMDINNDKDITQADADLILNYVLTHSN